jgi:hypothetical protein
LVPLLTLKEPWELGRSLGRECLRGDFEDGRDVADLRRRVRARY